jgi:hypothetical protein
VFVATAAVIGAVAQQSASSSEQSPDPAPRAVEPERPDDTFDGGDRRSTSVEVDGVVNDADGALPDRVTVFDDAYPGVVNLDPALLQALRHAARDAVDDGIELHVNSGWRSPEYQHQLLRQAVAEYGSEDEAARWVATPETSAHVAGNAVDIGPFDAAAWLAEHGADYGLCQTYANESWHFELRLDAIDHGCPGMYADPTHDPKMQP